MDNGSSSQDKDILDILKGLESRKPKYPPDLLAARRKLFLEQLEKYAPPEAAPELPAKDQQLIKFFRTLKALEPEYPPQVMARRRTLYKQQIAEIARSSVWHALRSSVRNLFAGGRSVPGPIYLKFARASALALSIAIFAFVAFALYGNTGQHNSPALAPGETFTAVAGTATSPVQAAVIICRDGYEPPLCLETEFDHSEDLTYPGNGKARPAVAKDTFPGVGQVHSAAHVNDGRYGSDASWVSNSPNSWIKIDLGTTTDINTVAFGRDRLGNLNDGDPGRFVIAVAISDDVYANGNSSNDASEYVQVYDSELVGFDGTISGPETVIALFEMKQARFIKIIFENARTAIDEVDAFVSDPSAIANKPTKAVPGEDTDPEASTPVAVHTPQPNDTATALPTDTLPPTDSITPVPTDPLPPPETPTPIDTPIPTDTPVPVDPTVPALTDTPIPPASYPPTFPPSDEPTATNEPVSLLPGQILDLSGEDMGLM